MTHLLFSYQYGLYIAGIGVRLVNGSAYNEGRVEIFHANEWGSLCDNTFDVLDGQVICRMLGLDSE